MSEIDDIAVILAAEEHRQGKPYLADPEHCAKCAEVDQAWDQATCEHNDRVNIRAIEDRFDRWLCERCGHQWHGDPVPTVPPPPIYVADDELVEWFPV